PPLDAFHFKPNRVEDNHPAAAGPAPHTLTPDTVGPTWK
ncbi:MAG: hypothetical protein JWP63_4004, partial [Candidatus Solibacter sp.]|nr:hypothetical protein [Candidatus Solibacter sp.]